MEDLIIPRFQFEIRYSQLFDFNSSIRKILSPFLRFANKVNVQNEGRLTESIVLVNEEDAYFFDCRWDRILLVSEGKLTKFTSENAPPFSVLFDLFGNISKLKDFGKINNTLLLIDFLELSEDKPNEIFTKIYKSLINEYADKILEGVNDAAITLEQKKDGNETSITIGPFVEGDVIKHNLFPLSSSLVTETIGKSGLLMFTKIFEINAKVDYPTLSKNINKLYKCFENYKKVYGKT